MTWPVSAGASHDEKARYKTETLRFQATKKPIQSGPTPSVFCFRVHGSQPLVSVLSLCTVLGSSYNRSAPRRLPRRGNQRAVAAAADPVWMDTQLGRGVSALGPGPTAGRKARVGIARRGLEI